jgi:hypothetical protein
MGIYTSEMILSETKVYDPSIFFCPPSLSLLTKRWAFASAGSILSTLFTIYEL